MQLKEIVKILKSVCGKKSQALYVNGFIEACTPDGNLVRFECPLDCNIGAQLTIEDWELVSKLDNPVLSGFDDGQSGVQVKTASGYNATLANYVVNTRRSAFDPVNKSACDNPLPAQYFDKALLVSSGESDVRKNLSFVHTTQVADLGKFVFTTNGHVLTAIRCEHEGLSVPQELVNIVHAMMPKSKKAVIPSVYTNNDATVYIMGDMSYLDAGKNSKSPPEVGSYLTYHPDATQVTVEVKQLQEKFKVAKELGLNGISCGLKVCDNVLTLYFHSKNCDAKQEFLVQVVASKDTPTSFVASGHHSYQDAEQQSRLGVNPQYIEGALATFTEPQVQIIFPQDNISPVLIHNNDKTKIVLVMPMRT